MKKITLLFIFLIVILVVQAQERHIITSDGVHLYVKVKGKGTPCLYIHGGPGSGSHWMEEFFGDFLERNFQMIYLDQRGVGLSSSPKDNNYSMDRMVKDFEEVRKSLGIKQWITLGHSFGGVLQMGYAERYPKSIKGMIMINCTLNMRESFCKSWFPEAYKILNIKDTTKCMNDSTSVLLNNLINLIGKLNEKNSTWKMTFALQNNEKRLNETYNEIPDWNHDFGNIAFTIKDYWNNYKPNTLSMRMPVLFFYGRSDWNVGPNHYKGIIFPNMILWGSNVGHMPFLENKSDLEKAIKQYIEKYKL